ncbi:unnamed protein product [Paramecium primaurelia]|uniref:Calpain catalytic domain-containing protein n=1 Tax=Paramecium primaurelia TaxID=5886 RepID=A0A8S1N1W2_PARPR|nr:unnamed protein product [Paramecium primaurelia]
MQEKLQDAYNKGLQIIEQYEDNSNETTQCLYDKDYQKIQFYSIYDIEIPNSLIPCKQFGISQLYNNFALINAFNVLQSQIYLMKSIFERTEDPFAVWLCDQGEWKIIIVNDKVPCVKNVNNKIETTFKCNLQWPIIIEKAIVKLLGDSYNLLNDLVTTSISSFIYLLIGQPISKIQMKTIQELQSQLEQKNSIFYIEVYYKQRHNAYVITSVKENNVVLQAINQDLIYNEGVILQDSKFLLKWSQFQLQTIFQVHLNYGYQTYTFTMQQPMKRIQQFIEHTYIYTFKINNKQKNEATYWISICQRDQNMNSSQQKKEIKYGLIRLLLFKNNNKTYQFLSESIDCNQNLFLETELSSGTYTLVCQAEYFDFESIPEELQNQQSTLKLQIQGIQITQKFDQTNQNEQKLRELIITMIRQKTTTQNLYIYKDEEFPQVQRTLERTKGFLYIYYENHGDSNFEEYLEFITHRNLIRHETQEMDTKIKVSIPPKQYMLYLYKFDPKVLLDSNSISFEYQISFYNKIQSEIVERPSLFDYIYSQKNLQYKEIKNPEIFIQQHGQGVLFLFQNIESNSIDVECDLTLNNLKILYNDTITLKEKIIKFQMKPKTKQFILLEIINQRQKYYNYKMKVSVQNLK